MNDNGTKATVQAICDAHGLKGYDAGFAVGLAFASTVAGGGMIRRAERHLTACLAELAAAYDRKGQDKNILLRVHACGLDIIRA